ncbi:MAG TPA: NfeD family protein [Woeseiaceae bacterium]|nr:NfeD family protein [Woeseiaceae bacterium]
MSGKRTSSQGRSETGVIAFYAGLVAAVVFALLADGLFRIVALSVLGLFVLHFLIGDVLLAVSDERATKRNPHDNRVSDVGRKVRVIEDFVSASTGSRGRVSLAGETWKARSRDGTLHRAGDELVVADVEGLVLIVEHAPNRGQG